jgi:hypothetical protein
MTRALQDCNGLATFPLKNNRGAANQLRWPKNEQGFPDFIGVFPVRALAGDGPLPVLPDGTRVWRCCNVLR